MSERKSKEFDAVDLTEDEDSSEGNPGVDSPFHFVDCAKIAPDPAPGPLNAPSPLSLNTTRPLPLQVPGLALATTFSVNVPKKRLQAVITSVQTPSNKVEQSTSVQAKSFTTTKTSGSQDMLEGDTLQEIETVTIDSDNENSAKNPPNTQPVQQNQTVMEKHPPGKVVIIKKNNKYYKIVIPHNVMPSIDQAVGPVLINIPEVGPLVISNDPHAAKLRSNQMQHVSLNYDALGANRGTPSVIKLKNQDSLKAPQTQTTPNSRYGHLNEVLWDKKYCWTYNRFRKRDLEGFTCNDRLGFTMAETKRVGKCEKILSAAVKKLETKLKEQEEAYENFSVLKMKSNKVKLVQINSIIKPKRRRRGRKIKQEVEALPVNDDVDMEGYHDGLLLTKKVVILNDHHKEVKRNPAVGSRKTSTGKVGRPRKRPRKDIQMTPCFVQITRDKVVEDASTNYCKAAGKRRMSGPRRRPVPNVDPLNARPGLPGDNPLVLRQSSFLENINLILRSRIIKTEEKLKVEVSNFKPVLIMTDATLGMNKDLKTYCNEFTRNNIIYVVNSAKPLPELILTNDDFISAVELGYIKLVDTDLFCKFVANGMSIPGGGVMQQMEHNYCSRKK
ncbi:hypothetical protein NQ315_016363 [Exocentrus adspersus]|uniref:Uncharacterized protein n=1 Tax=Exocentrus adspersus TaxID=1586481 RepID=A0AAV8VPX2_9CUCU|nr:hypothetical protein NQ315_016363 [Exocentrus adspersus]